MSEFKLSRVKIKDMPGAKEIRIDKRLFASDIKKKEDASDGERVKRRHETKG